MFLARFRHDTFLVSLILSFADMHFLKPGLLNPITREEGKLAAEKINATYVETNTATTRNIGLAFSTCLNLYINAYAEKGPMKKEKSNKPKSFSKSAFKRCVKFAS